MHFNLITWLFQDPYTAGVDAGKSGAETFHFLVPWLVFSCAGLLIWFYYTVEGRKRFVKSKPILKYMFDRYLNWFAILCFIALPIIFCRVYLDGYFFAWRVWRYLWLVSLVVWAALWLRYLLWKYPAERESFIAYQQRQQYIPKSSKRKAKAKAKAGSR